MEKRTIQQVRCLPPGNSQKRISLTQLPSLLPGALVAPGRSDVPVVKIEMTGRHFDESLGCLISPALDELATQLSFVEGLSAKDREVIIDATRESLYTVLHTKVSRLLVLELNAARVTGKLSAENSEQRWQQFLELSSQRSFWDDLATHYPSLSRVDAIVRKRCMAALLFAQRWTTDRHRLEGLCNGDPGELSELNFCAGDSHRGGLTVAIVRGEG